MSEYRNLEEALCRELEKLDKKYAGDTEMTETDVERARKLYHALKSAEGYRAMVEDHMEPGMSGRYRNPRNGRYMSGNYPEHYEYPMPYRPDRW
ncbi:MAG: hypothetical protein J6N19_04945 [Clostridium sp.]|nr:hypothetical protein [Clostridium sp.]